MIVVVGPLDLWLVAVAAVEVAIMKIVGWELDVGVADVGLDVSLLATVAGAETLYLYIK